MDTSERPTPLQPAPPNKAGERRRVDLKPYPRIESEQELAEEERWTEQWWKTLYEADD